MVRRRISLCILFFITFLLSRPELMMAETSPHQRIGVQAKTVLELSPRVSMELSREVVGEEPVISGQVSAGLGALILRTISFDLNVPFSGRFFTRLDSSPRFVYALGDVSAAIGGNFRLSDWRIVLDASYTHPFGVYSYYESMEKKTTSGNGYRTIATSVAAIRYLDPLALGIRLKGETRLTRQERFGTSSRPAAFSLGFFATEALNSEVALTASLVQGIALPRLVNNGPDVTGYSFSFSGSVGVIVSGTNSSFKVIISKLLSEISSPVSLSITFSPTIRIKEPNHESLSK